MHCCYVLCSNMFSVTEIKQRKEKWHHFPLNVTMQLQGVLGLDK